MFFFYHDPVQLSLLCKHTNGAFSVITYTRQHISPRQLHFSLSETNKGENKRDAADLGDNSSTVLYILTVYCSLFEPDHIL